MSNWLVDPAIHQLDCGDNSCRYATKKGGMRTNGGCRCASNNGKNVEFFLRQNYHAALEKIKGLEAELQSIAEDEAGASL